MYKAFFYTFIISTIVCHPHIALAGANLDQRLKAVQQQRIQQQQQLRQQAMLKQRQAEQVAVAQQVAKQQIEVMQQQLAMQQAAHVSQQQLVKQQLQQQAIYQQKAYNEAVQAQQSLRQQQAVSNKPANLAAYPGYEPYVEEVVDMATLWEDLKISSEAWPLIIDMKAKEIIVAKFIEDYRMKGVQITKDPYYYAQMIDSMSFDKPEILKNPFDKVLQIVAIVEYDFNNGANPDMMARQVLGDQGYLQNKKRLGK